jgi:glycine cleavage system transcriptional repressor
MNRYAVLQASGPDRPGLVDSISKFILQCGCNIEDSRMAILGGEFAMLILVTGQDAAVEKLLKGAKKAGQQAGLAVQARKTKAPSAAAPKGTLPYEVTAHSMDHPGIVQRIAGFLAEHQINIRALDTSVTNAPVTGLPLFSLHAAVDMPAQQNVAEIRRGLEKLAAQENIDVELKPG